MNIILVSGAAARARTVALDWRHAATAGAVLVLLFTAFWLTFNYLAARLGTATQGAWLQAAAFESQREQSEELVQAHLNAMAIRLGELEAQMLRLDALGERLGKLAGLEASELQSLRAGKAPGRGGAESPLPSHALSTSALAKLLAELATQVERRNDQLGVLETLLLQHSVRRKFLPTLAPIVDGWHSSNFGYRIDPFTGLHSFHEGVDFPAESGTPIVAAASGTVVSTEVHPQYGKMLEIDHGNGLASRYAHTSRVLVKEGDLVMRGQRVATVGSTGRSTGPHLHFEVRQNGIPQNPARFLQSSN